MFWSIFFDSLILILAILAVGWVVSALIGRKESSRNTQDQ
jgi:hypothetical protein